MGKIELFTSCIIMTISFYIMGCLLFSKKQKPNIKAILSTIIFAIVIMIINLTAPSIIDNVLKIIIIFTCYIGFFKVIFQEDLNKLITASFLMYLVLFISEIVVDILVNLIVNIFNYKSMEYFRNGIIVNLVISLGSVLIVYVFKEKLSSLVKRISNGKRGIIIISMVILMTLALLIFKTPLKDIKLDSNFIITMLLLMLFCIIGFILMRQLHETEKILDKYTKLAQYSQNNEGLLEEYRVNLHESKNQLILINNMVPKKYKEIHEYIDGLIKQNQSGKYYWLTELKYVPLPELKGFMNFKIMEMIDQGLDVEINISREINKSVLKNYKPKDKEDLYSIVGIFLDNAREAAKESKEKSVSVQMYMEKKKLKLIIANTYKGKINLDKIDEYGYSSKGTNRGTGLHIVSGIVERNQLFDKETSILDNYFVQSLTINPKKAKKKKKK